MGWFERVVWFVGGVERTVREGGEERENKSMFSPWRTGAHVAIISPNFCD